ncbi:hypothetical protein Pan216_54660 [Planctomycetes bacterium Pan216]|uniref:VWFA domain-containing protein n=1 Tax=Kolteria novifilia TaxID=2527975 RepID=A0A518BC72_9BACT|nr:hypothetical protein Pan216_54660 [Planctomycetes bacterium Pan216]
MGFFKHVANKTPQFGVSVLIHVVVLWILWLRVMEAQIEPKTVAVITEIQELEKQEEFHELLNEKGVEFSTPVSLNPGGGGGGGLAGEMDSIATPSEAMQAMAEAFTVTDRSVVRPLSYGLVDTKLDAMVSGIKGETVSTGSTGDSGAVDRITLEILRQLDKDKSLVVWIMDSSGSLAERREKIASKLERIYRELDELGVNSENALLSSVMSVGQETRFLLREPTNDNEEIKRAIRSIVDDGTGQENMFRAIRDAAIKFRRYQTSGGRSLVLILVTDEIGDDGFQADEAVALCRRNRVPIYVMGPMATFGLNVIHDTWTDPEHGFRFWLPLRRGPFTRFDEVSRVAFNGHRYRSGFGPFALVQLARETGGIYFLYPDERVPGPRYALEILNRYRPNYGDLGDYYKETGASSFRRRLVEVVTQGNKLWRHAWPYPWIHESVWNKEIDQRQKECLSFLSFASKAIPLLEQVADQYDEETIPRWQANFDLTMARILKAKVQCEEYGLALEEFRKKPRVLKDPKKNNGWRIKWGDEVRVFGDKKDSKQDKNAAIRKAEIEKSRFFYDRIIKRHPGTPWAEAAKREMNWKVGIQLEEGHDWDHLSAEDRAKRAKVKVKQL